jgi:hypothetical protein
MTKTEWKEIVNAEVHFETTPVINAATTTPAPKHYVAQAAYYLETNKVYKCESLYCKDLPVI